MVISFKKKNRAGKCVWGKGNGCDFRVAKESLRSLKSWDWARYTEKRSTQRNYKYKGPELQVSLTRSRNTRRLVQLKQNEWEERKKGDQTSITGISKLQLKGWTAFKFFLKFYFCGCFLATTAELNSCKRLYSPQTAKYLLYGSL